jgi:CBS domain-containing protein
VWTINKSNLLRPTYLNPIGEIVPRFEVHHNAGHMVFVYGDDNLMAALRAMWRHRLSGVPILDRSSKQLIGNVRYNDLRIILDKPHVFNQRRFVL